MEHIRKFSRYAFLYLGILLLLKSIVFGMEAKLIYFRFKTLPMTYILQIRCGGEGGFKNFSTGGSNVWNNHVGSRITSFNKKKTEFRKISPRVALWEVQLFFCLILSFHLILFTIEKKKMPSPKRLASVVKPWKEKPKQLKSEYQSKKLQRKMSRSKKRSYELWYLKTLHVNLKRCWKLCNLRMGFAHLPYYSIISCKILSN